MQTNFATVHSTVRIFCALFLTGVAEAAEPVAPTAPDLLDRVDKASFSSMPFGMMMAGLDPRRAYQFTCTRFNGAWDGMFSGAKDLPFTVVTGPVTEWRTIPLSKTPAWQIAGKPHDLRYVTPEGIGIEIVSAQRSCLVRCTIPAGQAMALLYQAVGTPYSNYNLKEVEGAVKQSGGKFPHITVERANAAQRLEFTAQGLRLMGRKALSPQGNGDRVTPVFGSVQFQEPPTSKGLMAGNTALEGDLVEGVIPKGAPVPFAWASWKAGDKARTVTFALGMSFVDADGADRNLAAEQPDFDLERQRIQTAAAWRKVYSEISIPQGPEPLLRQFANQSWMTMLHPNIWQDVDGRYTGFDLKTHTSTKPIYVTWSSWDLWRTWAQLMGSTHPEIASDMMHSYVLAANEGGGGLPRWTAMNQETGVMSGDPAPPIITSAWAFGARSFNLAEALTAMRRGAEDPEIRCQGFVVRRGLQHYLAKGWVGNASITMEYAIADFAISRAAAALKQGDIELTYLKRAANWRNVIDPEKKTLVAREVDRSIPEAKYPGYTSWWSAKLVEGSGETYQWMVPQDMDALIVRLGGRDAAEAKLDAEVRFDQTVNTKKGLFVGNEPQFALSWAYYWLDRPGKAMALSRTLVENRQYGGDDDLGGCPHRSFGICSAFILRSRPWAAGASAARSFQRQPCASALIAT